MPGKCIDFFNEVMNLAMQEGHIPDFSMKESKFVTLSFYTYPAGGLTLNDFIMAAKLNAKGRRIIFIKTFFFSIISG